MTSLNRRFPGYTRGTGQCYCCLMDSQCSSLSELQLTFSNIHSIHLSKEILSELQLMFSNIHFDTSVQAILSNIHFDTPVQAILCNIHFDTPVQAILSNIHLDAPVQADPSLRFIILLLECLALKKENSMESFSFYKQINSVRKHTLLLSKSVRGKDCNI